MNNQHIIKENYEMFIFNNKIFIWSKNKNLFMSENSLSTNIFKKLTKKNIFFHNFGEYYYIKINCHKNDIIENYYESFELFKEMYQKLSNYNTIIDNKIINQIIKIFDKNCMENKTVIKKCTNCNKKLTMIDNSLGNCKGCFIKFCLHCNLKEAHQCKSLYIKPKLKLEQVIPSKVDKL